ncbi:sigma 54-interacting transcriptional regulator [Thermodesulfobacteriota bacterium]
MTEKKSKKEGLVFYEQLCSMLDNLLIGAFTIDPHRNITTFNRAAETLTGYEAKDVIGKHCDHVFPDELCSGECKFDEAVEAEQKSLSCRVEISSRQNEKRKLTKIVTPLYDEHHKLMGCIEIFQDHSALEELINRIRYDERKLKIILDNLDIGVFTVSRGGHINFFNTIAESISGFNRKEVLGKHCTVILGKERSDGAPLLEQTIGDGNPRSNKKILMTAKDGRPIPIRANYMALRNENDQTVGGLVTIQDLSLIDQLNKAISSRYTFADMVGKDPAMQKLFEIIPIIADSESTVLIEGPTGTGKDLLAKVIHNSSRRTKKPMVKVNCAALPDNLLESEMFGYVRGAFTGADRDKPGRFQEADGGTIFLDEIGDLPLSLQAKLLRVLEDQEFYPLGSRKTTKVDVRIIAATNQGLGTLVQEKRFREDLYYRLNVIRLELPPLKDRKGDIPLLIDHALKRLAAVKDTEVNRISEEAMEMLLNYEYPGNIRELENILEHALIICQEESLELKHLPIFLQKGISPSKPLETSDQDFEARRQSSEKRLIIEMLGRHNWHRGKAARELNIDRTTLWRKMKRYNLSE